MFIVHHAPSREGAYKKDHILLHVRATGCPQPVAFDTRAVVTQLKVHHSTDFAAVLRGPLRGSLVHR